MLILQQHLSIRGFLMSEASAMFHHQFTEGLQQFPDGIARCQENKRAADGQSGEMVHKLAPIAATKKQEKNDGTGSGDDDGDGVVKVKIASHMW